MLDYHHGGLDEYVFLCTFLSISLKFRALYLFPRVVCKKNSFLVSVFSVAMIKYFSKSNLKEKGFIPVYSLRERSPSWQVGRRSREELLTANPSQQAGAVAASSTHFPVPISTVQKHPPHSVQPVSPSQACAETCLQVTTAPVKLTTLTSRHTLSTLRNVKEMATLLLS